LAEKDYPLNLTPAVLSQLHIAAAAAAIEQPAPEIGHGW
jgi:hypothetical protein